MDKAALSQQPYLTFFSDDTADYDVIVDQSSSAPNLKEATWGALQPVLPLMAERMGPEEIALVLEYSPLPESFLEKLKAIQEQKAQQPPPPDPEMMKVEAMQKAKAAELQMKQKEAEVDAQLEQQKTAQQLELEKVKAAAQIQLEREKAQAQLMLEKERANSEMALKASSAKSDMAIKASMARMDMQGKASKYKAEAEAAGESEVEDDGEEMPEAEDMDLFGNKALADALTQMSQAIAMMAQANAESQRMMAQGVAALGSELKEAMTKPKQIVRGPDGRAIGVQ